MKLVRHVAPLSRQNNKGNYTLLYVLVNERVGGHLLAWFFNSPLITSHGFLFVSGTKSTLKMRKKRTIVMYRKNVYGFMASLIELYVNTMVRLKIQLHATQTLLTTPLALVGTSSPTINQGIFPEKSITNFFR